MIIIHGDRVETLACAIVGSLNNIRTAHIEGGEVSGTVDEILRHSISKLSHLHFVTNKKAKQRLEELKEREIKLNNELLELRAMPNTISSEKTRLQKLIDDNKKAYDTIANELQQKEQAANEINKKLKEAGVK